MLSIKVDALTTIYKVEEVKDSKDKSLLSAEEKLDNKDLLEGAMQLKRFY